MKPISFIINSFLDPEDRLLRTGVLLCGTFVVMIVCFFLEVQFHLYRHKPFDESGLITRLSVLLLTVVSIYSGWTYVLRKRNDGRRGWAQPRFFWLLTSLGFAFLALDEKILVHESIGHFIRSHFAGQGMFGSRMDDFVMAGYGVGAVFVVWYYRKEIFRAPRSIAYGIGGFLGLLGMVILDILSHKADILELFIADPAQAERLLRVLSGGEEICKLIGEAFFVAAAHAAMRHASRETLPGDPELLVRNRRWRRTMLLGLLVLSVVFTLEHLHMFARIGDTHLIPMAAFSLLAAKAMRRPAPIAPGQ